MKHLARPKLLKVAEIMDIFITQDRDGFVQLWTRKPQLNYRLGIWEGVNDPILSRDNPLISQYKADRKWHKSLITPLTRQQEEDLWP